MIETLSEDLKWDFMVAAQRGKGSLVTESLEKATRFIPETCAARWARVYGAHRLLVDRGRGVFWGTVFKRRPLPVQVLSKTLPVNEAKAHGVESHEVILHLPDGLSRRVILIRIHTGE